MVELLAQLGCMRVWIGSVTILAVVVAVYELAQVLGWHPPFGDLTVSAVLVTALVAVFAYVFARTRNQPVNGAAPAAALVSGEGI